MVKVPSRFVYRVFSPRLVVLVTTVDGKGHVNAAPFSFCGLLEIHPPTVYLSTRPSQDTYKNILETKEFVFNIVSEDFAQKAINCEEKLPSDVNELEVFGLGMQPAEKVRPPRVEEAKAVLECKLLREIDIGCEHVLIIGRVVSAHCEHLENNFPVLEKIKPVMHIGSEQFSTVGRTIKLRRK
ncbi:MAG: flavin reductase family protein [Methanobacteriota archaeon]|nr:MAG: flavin reductase family protein [Euryarchaeota archaeon]